MRNTYILLPGLFLLISCLAFSCKKEDTGCFSQEMYDTHKGDICPDNCFGVIGCDGNTYCSECDANRSGIAVE
jgi:hypothetical protein